MLDPRDALRASPSIALVLPINSWVKPALVYCCKENLRRSAKPPSLSSGVPLSRADLSQAGKRGLGAGEAAHGCSGQAFPETPALCPGKFPCIPFAGAAWAGLSPALPSPAGRDGPGRTDGRTGGSAPPRSARDAGPGRGRPQPLGVSRAMANVKVAVRVRPLSKRCGATRRGTGGSGGRGSGGDRVPRVLLGCRGSCQPGRDRRPGAAQPRLREARQEGWQPLAASLSSLESLLRKITSGAVRLTSLFLSSPKQANCYTVSRSLPFPFCCCCFFQREAEPDIPIVAQLRSLPGLLGSNGNPKKLHITAGRQLPQTRRCRSTMLWCYLYTIRA